MPRHLTPSLGMQAGSEIIEAGIFDHFSDRMRHHNHQGSLWTQNTFQFQQNRTWIFFILFSYDSFVEESRVVR